MATAPMLLQDDPLPGVRRLTLNRPEKRNALSNELRAAILTAVRAADSDPAVKVSILRGAGPAFSSGYDLSADNSVGQPFYSPGGPGQWARHVVESWRWPSPPRRVRPTARSSSATAAACATC